jgi:hypothetical protein
LSPQGYTTKVRKGFCLLGLLFCFVTHAQVVLPTFGVRGDGDVPEALVEAFMVQLRQDVQELGFTAKDSELITPGIAGSLDIKIAYVATEYENVRYVVLGEIQESQTAYTVSILIADGQEKRSSDIISEPLDPTQIAATSQKLAQSVRDFIESKVPLEGSAELFVSSEPRGAVLFIDGIEKGPTGNIVRLQPGIYTVEVRLEGYLPESRRIELQEEGSIETIRITLQQSAGGSLQILSVPSAEVFIDDQLEGVTPLTVSALPGTHQVRLQRAGFLPSVSEHLIKVNRVSRVGRVILEPQFERMVYWEAKDAPLLRLDGVVQTSSYAELLPGSHTVELSRDGQAMSFSFTMPETGVFALDFESQSLVPHPEE